MKRQVTLFSLFYFPTTIFVGLLWADSSNLRNIVFFALWQLVMAKVIYDMVWLATALWPKDQNLRKLSKLRETPPVALLYTCRDDILDESLLGLVDQDYPNYDIYILDDSQKEASRDRIDQLVRDIKVRGSQTRINVLRRKNISGYKAGNLNNWLTTLGDQFKYFIIFDNDSLAGKDFITQLVQYAEHPENDQTAIFQSLILPWNENNYFVKWVGALSPLYIMLIMRNGNRTGTTVSFGHNNLHRTAIFQELGGFNQELTSEDTVATFELDRMGYKTEIVDITSYEAEPADIIRYRQRAVRWAAQTVALFRHPWKHVSGALKVELSRQMMYYLINTVFLFWVVGSLWPFDGILPLGEQYQQIVALRSSYDKVYFASFIFVICIIACYFSLHFLLAVKCKISVLDYLGHLVVSSAIFFFTILPVTFAILEGTFGKKVDFNPSNLETRPVSLLGLIGEMKFMWAGGLISLSQYFIYQKLPWDYLGGLWALFIFLTPFILFYLHRIPVTGDYHAHNTSKKQVAEKHISV